MAFSYLLAPTTTVEASGAATRTTTITYLADGRDDSHGPDRVGTVAGAESLAVQFGDDHGVLDRMTLPRPLHGVVSIPMTVGLSN